MPHSNSPPPAQGSPVTTASPVSSTPDGLPGPTESPVEQGAAALHFGAAGAGLLVFLNARRGFSGPTESLGEQGTAGAGLLVILDARRGFSGLTESLGEQGAAGAGLLVFLDAHRGFSGPTESLGEQGAAALHLGAHGARVARLPRGTYRGCNTGVRQLLIVAFSTPLHPSGDHAASSIVSRFLLARPPTDTVVPSVLPRPTTPSTIECILAYELLVLLPS